MVFLYDYLSRYFFECTVFFKERIFGQTRYVQFNISKHFCLMWPIARKFTLIRITKKDQEWCECPLAPRPVVVCPWDALVLWTIRWYLLKKRCKWLRRGPRPAVLFTRSNERAFKCTHLRWCTPVARGHRLVSSSPDGSTNKTQKELCTYLCTYSISSTVLWLYA